MITGPDPGGPRGRQKRPAESAAPRAVSARTEGRRGASARIRDGHHLARSWQAAAHDIGLEGSKGRVVSVVSHTMAAAPRARRPAGATPPRGRHGEGRRFGPRPGGPLSWRVTCRADVTTVVFSGDLAGHTDFGALPAQLRGRVRFELAEVVRLNSFGIRNFVHFARSLARVDELVLARCSPAVVGTSSWCRPSGGARGSSRCSRRTCACSAVTSRTACSSRRVGLCRGRPPAADVPCNVCGAPLELDEVPIATSPSWTERPPGTGCDDVLKRRGCTPWAQ